MPDLHGWITQQIDHVEETARAVEDRSAPWDGQWMADGNSAVRTVNGHVLFYRHGPDPLKPGLADHVALHDPAAVLRRCGADRKILEVHAPAGTKWDPYACNGCGVDSEYGHEVGHTNDCETLLALAEGYGLTPEILTGLDRPEPERPVYSGESGSVIGDSIARLYADLYKGLLASTFTAAEAERLVTGDGTGAPLGFFALEAAPEPTPAERAFAILEPHLVGVTLYRPRHRWPVVR